MTLRKTTGRGGRPAFEEAVAALDAGDAARLRELLAENPGLVRERAPAAAPGEEGPAAGYFHRATLLHHVAGNPRRGPMPANAVELARILLDAGADVDASCGGGPSQPESGGGTTLGLVMSSAAAVESGQAAGLIDLLLERGARAGFEDGGLLRVALYHTVECRRQREAAEHLRAKGAPVDLWTAAGLGELETVKGFFAPGADGGAPADGLRPEAAAFWRSRRGRDEQPSDREILTEALAGACANGRDEVAAFLMDRGASPDELTRHGPMTVTPLHCAAWAGWPSTCRLLIERGASVTVCDPEHGNTPLGWATYCERAECIAVFLERPERLTEIDALEHLPDEEVKSRLAGLDPNAAVGPGEPGVLLRIAAWTGREEIVRWLLEQGADPAFRTSKGSTAADIARRRGFDRIATLLDGKIP